MRIADVVEGNLEFDSNLLNRQALIDLIGPMSRRQKRKVVVQNMGFLAGALKYNDAGLNADCLELFLELSIVPLLSSDQRTHMLIHGDDRMRELAEELFLDAT